MNNTNLALVPILEKDINLNIEIIPSPTPTTIKLIKPNIDLEKLPLITIKPTATPTATQSGGQATPTDKVVVVTATPTIKEEITIAPSPSSEVTTAPKNEIGNNQVVWFLAAVIGILVIIVLAQAWPKKEDRQDDSQ